MRITSTGRRRGVAGLALAATAALALSACSVTGAGSSSGGEGDGTGTINALFMKQAGYSEENIKEMISSFQSAHKDIKVTADFVSYEALHDKIVAAAPAGTYDVVLIDVIWPAEFGSKNIVADVTDRWPAAWKQQMLGGAVATPQNDGKFYGVPWILDTKYFFANTAHLKQAKIDPASLDTWPGVLDAAKALKSAVTLMSLWADWNEEIISLMFSSE